MSITFGGYAGLFKTLEFPSTHSDKTKLSYLAAANKVIKNKLYLKDRGITVTQNFQLSIVTPAKCSPLPDNKINIYSNIKSPGLLYRVFKSFQGMMAVDLETRGVQAADPDCTIVGIGVATLDKSAYFDFKTNSPETNQAVLDWLSEYKDGLVGHNVMFDGTFLLRETGKWLDWRFDTYALYRQLANEGYPGFQYGLKAAQLQLLNWETKGDIQLDRWLIDNGYYSNISKIQSNGYYQGPDIKGEARFYIPKKAEMWRAPAAILGYYCCLDTIATIQLLEHVFLPSIRGHQWEQTFLDYTKTFMINVKLLANQQLTGITIDKQGLINYSYELEKQIEEATNKFLNHPDIRGFADKLKQEAVDSIAESEPEKYKKMKPLGQEPAKFKKDGTISQNYIKYCEKRDNQKPEISQLWLRWELRLKEAETTEHLNLRSPQQLARLFYQELNFPIMVRTESGEPGIGVDALPGFGEPGKLLRATRDLEKELGYVKGCIDNLIKDNEGYWRLHPQFKVPGTKTCRLAGSGGVNLQQIPKSEDYLKHWKPKPGKVWIDFDFAALEQVVMAELTRDPSMWKIYGPEAKKNDIYLFNGAALPVIGPVIRAAGYDPDNPDPETIGKVKKECKKERGISKTITLGSSYGMGANTLRRNLGLAGIDITEDESFSMHKAYWELYGQVKDYEKFLLGQLKDNNGFVLNGIGRPVCCAGDYTKDLVNRVVQSTGHDILMMWIQIYSEMFDNEGINWDGIVLDFHDQSIIECNEQDAQRVLEILSKESVDRLNSKLEGLINMRVDGGIIKNLAQAKCEDYKPDKIDILVAED